MEAVEEALALGRAGQLQAAVEHLDAVLSDDPHLVAARYVRGFLHERLRHAAEAQADYEACLQDDPTHAAASYQLAGLYAARGELTAAVAHLQSSIQHETDGEKLIALHKTRGLLCSKAGALEDAVHDLAYAIRHLRQADLYYERGLCLERLGQLIGAMQDFTWCLALQPHLGIARVARGQVQIHLGRLPEAVADFDVALEQASRDTDALEGRAIAWLLRGDGAKAAVDAQAFLRIAGWNDRMALVAARGLQLSGENASKLLERIADDAVVELPQPAVGVVWETCKEGDDPLVAACSTELAHAAHLAQGWLKAHDQAVLDDALLEMVAPDLRHPRFQLLEACELTSWPPPEPR